MSKARKSPVAEEAEDFRFLIAIQALSENSEASNAEREEAAATAVRLAYERGERLLWSFLLMRFEEFVRRGEPVPRALLEGLAAAFTRFAGGATMDEAFGLRRAGPGFVDSMERRFRAATNAQLVEGYIKRDGLTLEEALARAVAMRGGKVSESQLKRDYYKHRDPVKRKDSE